MNTNNLCSLEQRHALIANHPFFSLFNDELIHELAKQLHEKVCVKGSIIVKQGDLVDAVYLIAKGNAEVSCTYTTLEKKTSVVLAILKPGDAIGLNALGFFSQEGIRSATITALDDVVVLGISLSKLHDFFKTTSHLYLNTQLDAQRILQINILRQVKEFAALPFIEISRLEQKLILQHIKANEIIFREGDVCDKCYFVIQGEIALLKNNDSLEHPRKIIIPMQIFGDELLHKQTQRDSTAQALEDGELLTLPNDAINSVIKQKPKKGFRKS